MRASGIPHGLCPQGVPFAYGQGVDRAYLKKEVGVISATATLQDCVRLKAVDERVTVEMVEVEGWPGYVTGFENDRESGTAQNDEKRQSGNPMKAQ